MQEGSVIREHRKLGPDVWSYRWWESGPSGNRVHRRIVLGTAEQLRDISSARQMTADLIAGNQCHRHPDGWNVHNSGTVG